MAFDTKEKGLGYGMPWCFHVGRQWGGGTVLAAGLWLFHRLAGGFPHADSRGDPPEPGFLLL